MKNIDLISKIIRFFKIDSKLRKANLYQLIFQTRIPSLTFLSSFKEAASNETLKFRIDRLLLGSSVFLTTKIVSRSGPSTR